jgi:hypothetical protein
LDADLTAPLYVDSGHVVTAMVSYQVPLDHIGELALERAAGLLGVLAWRSLGW